MTAERTFRLLAGLGLAAVVGPLLLAYRYLPCGDIAAVTLHAVGAACRLLGEAGLTTPLPVGVSLAALGVLALGTATARLSREIVLARDVDERLNSKLQPELQAHVRTLAARLELTECLRIVWSDRPHAFCAGLWRPRVYVTSRLLSLLGDRELEAVVLHEAYHAARRHPLRMAVARSLAWSAFYVPVLRDLEIHFLAAKEIDADRAVVAAMSTRDALAAALLVLVGAQATPAGAAGFDATAARIDALADGGSLPLRLTPLRVGLTVVTVIGSICLVLG